MVSDQTVWRLFDPADPHPNAKRLARWLAAAEVEVPAPDAKTVLIITRKRKAPPKPGEESKDKKGKFHEGKIWEWYYMVAAKDALLGFAPTGDPAKSKLKPFKAVKVLGDNFGIALDPEPTLIRPLHVWRQLQALKKASAEEVAAGAAAWDANPCEGEGGAFRLPWHLDGARRLFQTEGWFQNRSRPAGLC